MKRYTMRWRCEKHASNEEALVTLWEWVRVLWRMLREIGRPSPRESCPLVFLSEVRK